VQVSLLENTTLSATEISCIDSNNQTTDLQTQLNILCQLPNTTPSLSQEEQEKLDKISGIEEDVNNIKSTLQTPAEKKFYISQSRFSSTTIMIYGIAYGSNMIVAVGASGNVFSSENGICNVWR
jgi:hypothetical protein